MMQWIGQLLGVCVADSTAQVKNALSGHDPSFKPVSSPHRNSLVQGAAGNRAGILFFARDHEKRRAPIHRGKLPQNHQLRCPAKKFPDFQNRACQVVLAA
jgi:hypothetical protein